MGLYKVLILTVDCWNSKIGATSSRTYSALFSSIKECEVSNIYIREELPDDPCCKRYFQISESRIIQSLLKRNTVTGREVAYAEIHTPEDIQNANHQKQLYRKQRKHFYYTKKIIRELIWLFSPWKSKELDAFLDEVRPDIVIYAMEGYIHFNRICRYVVQKTGAKSIGYFWDDNFTYKQRPGNIGYYLFRYFQRKSVARLARRTTTFWAISPKTKKEADDYFHIDCKLLSKPTERELTAIPKYASPRLPIHMFYAGNLMIGRMETVRILTEVLKEINTHSILLTLDLYTPTDVPEDLANFGYGITFHEPVSQKEVLSLQNQADVLLFVEDIVGKDRKVARLSFSTKIPDYLSCGKCILAIGDEDTASMEYFRTENVALCATNEQEVRQCLSTIIENPNLMSEYGEKSFACACRNHDKKGIEQALRNMLEKELSS